MSLRPAVAVLLVGPQAAGKSTLASALADDLRRGGETVALVELDAIAAMALPTLPGWDVAHRIFETVTAQWVESGLTCVVAEGSGSRQEVDRVRDRLAVALVTVAVTADFDIALARAQADPTRERSRDRDFLSGVYAAWATELAAIDADVVVDTTSRSVGRCVALVRAGIDRARAAADDAPRSG